MKLATNLSYREIFNISIPLMLGSAGQNLLVVVEGAILYRLSEADFAAIGYAGMFYLIIAAIGFGMSRGGQILIARRLGEGNPKAVGHMFAEMFLLEMVLATFMFLVLMFVVPLVFPMFIKDPVICQKTLAFLYYRSFGVFLSYMGLAMITLYSAVARGKVIGYATAILGIINVFLCIGLVYGRFGLPAWGIEGAAIAATIAELATFVFFAGYMLLDKETQRYEIFKRHKLTFSKIKEQVVLSISTTAQALVSIGAWFLFFAMVERFMGKHELAIANLLRMMFLLFSIPSWGFTTGINTIVSNFIGQKAYNDVLPIIWKTAKLTLLMTFCFAFPFIFFPNTFLLPLLAGTEHVEVFFDAIPIFKILLLNLLMSAMGGVYFYGLVGTGAAKFGLRYQFYAMLIYIVYSYFVLAQPHPSLQLAWLSETIYWIALLSVTYFYLKSQRWQHDLPKNTPPPVS